MREAVCDTSPIQYLFQTNLLHLLAGFYSRVIKSERTRKTVLRLAGEHADAVRG